MKLVTMSKEAVKRFGWENGLKALKAAGFDGFDYTIYGEEWNLLSGERYLEHIEYVRKISEKVGLPCLQAHSPSPKIPHQISEEDYVNMSLRCMEAASYLGCKVIVVHPGCSYTAQMNKERLYDKLLGAAEKLGISVATENMFSWKDSTETETVPSACGTAADFVEHIDCVSHPNFTACLDLGHAQMVNCEGAVALIRALGHDRIGALHVHDNDLYHDDHIFPFAGQSNWDEITTALAEIDYRGAFTYEADTFMDRYPDEVIPACLKLLESTGRYLIKEIERKRK